MNKTIEVSYTDGEGRRYETLWRSEVIEKMKAKYGNYSDSTLTRRLRWFRKEADAILDLPPRAEKFNYQHHYQCLTLFEDLRHQLGSVQEAQKLIKREGLPL